MDLVFGFIGFVCLVVIIFLICWEISGIIFK